MNANETTECGIQNTERRVKTVERRTVLGRLLSWAGYLLAKPLVPGLKESYQWLEVVQDKYAPSKWYVNLYEGPVLGQLDGSELKIHRIETGDGRKFKAGKLAARIWYSNGEKEQTF